MRAEGARVTQEGRELAGRRTGVAGRVPAALLALYDAARERNGGVGAARLEGRRTSASGTELSPADLDAITRLPPDAVAQDPETGVVVVRA